VRSETASRNGERLPYLLDHVSLTRNAIPSYIPIPKQGASYGATGIERNTEILLISRSEEPERDKGH
jgi:hypothetical protein